MFLSVIKHTKTLSHFSLSHNVLAVAMCSTKALRFFCQIFCYIFLLLTVPILFLAVRPIIVRAGGFDWRLAALAASNGAAAIVLTLGVQFKNR